MAPAILSRGRVAAYRARGMAQVRELAARKVPPQKSEPAVGGCDETAPVDVAERAAETFSDLVGAFDAASGDGHHSEDDRRATKSFEKRQVVRPMGVLDADRVN